MNDNQEQNLEQTQTTTAIAQPAIDSKELPEETPKDIDWRKFKEARKREREAREAAELSAKTEKEKADALKAALETLVNKPTQQNASQEEDEDSRINKKVKQAIAEEKARNEREQAEKEHREMPSRLSQIHADFDQVCSSDNLDYLEYHYPEIARAFTSAPDSVQKWCDIYKAVKRFVPNSTTSSKEQKKAEKNLAKPQAMSTAGMTQTGDQAPQYLDDKRKQDNWKRMQLRMKGIA